MTNCFLYKSKFISIDQSSVIVPKIIGLKFYGI